MKEKLEGSAHGAGEADSPAADARVPLVERIGYGVGDFASGLYLNFFGLFLLYFLVDLGGIAPAAVGVMLLVTKLIDAITDPLMGAIADRTRSRFGRYRPYLLWGAIPFGLSGALVFAMPSLPPDKLLIWAYGTYTLAMLAYTLVNVPYSGLLGVISPSSDQRTAVTAWRMLFSAAAGICLGMFGTTLVRELGAGDEARGIFLTMCVIAAISALCLWTTFFTTRERIAPPPKNNALIGDIKVLVTTGPWLAVALAAILAVVAISARAGSALFFFKYVAGDDGAPVLLFLDRVALFYTALALGQITGVLLGNRLQRRFEKSHTVIFGGALKMLGILAFYLAPLDSVLLQTASQYAVGIGFGILMVLAFSMFTDIAEYIDWKSGLQMTGLVVSASIFAVKTGLALGASIPGFVLGLAGFTPDEAADEHVIEAIQIAFALIPALILAPAAIAMGFYSLTRAKIRRFEAELEIRRRRRS